MTPSFAAIRPIEIVLLILAAAIILLLGWIAFRLKRARVHSYHTASTWMLDLLESMPEIVIIFDSSQRIMEIINQKRTVEHYGYSSEDLVGKTITELEELEIFKEVAIIVRQHLQATLANKQTYDFDLEVNKDGKRYYTHSRTAPFGENDVIYYSQDITSRVEAEKEISRLKTFLQSIMDNLPVGVMVKNASDNFRYYFHNQRLLELFPDRKIQLGLNDFEANDPNPEKLHQEDLRVLDCDQPLTFERVFYNNETSTPAYWADATKSHFSDSEGNTFIITTVVETTDIRKKQLELESTRRHLSLALDVGNLGAGTYDVASRTFKSFYKQLVAKEGMTYDEIIKTIHPQDQSLYASIFNRLISGLTDKEHERVRFLIDGFYVWYEIFVMSLKDENGNVYQLLGSELNVNEEVEKQVELQEAKSKLELAFESAEISHWEFDAQTGVFSSDYPEVFESKGFTIPQYAECFAEEDAPLFMTGMDQLLKGEKQSMSLQARITFPGQQQRWFEIHAVVSKRNEEGTVSRLIGLRRDITALKITNELIELRNRAEESNRLKSAFLANMSHEIRTPLNAIVGFSNLIMESTEQNEELKEYFSIIERNNDLLLQLINDILDLSKIEAGQLDFHFTDFPVSAIFNNLRQVYESRLQPGVELQCALPDTDCRIHSELNRLTQVVSNFVSNAVKFTAKGSIIMGYSYTESGLRFYVRDTGKGIAAENLGSVFNRFAKFDSFVPGTGLGLSICETIVQYLGGEIGVVSEVGRGTEFWFTLPCEPARIAPQTT